MAAEIPLPPVGHSSLRLGRAFLRPHREQDHYELVRPVVTVSNEGDRSVTESHPEAVPLAIYRAKRRGDKIDMTQHSLLGPPPEMRTVDQKTGRPIDLILVWWPGQESEDETAGQ